MLMSIVLWRLVQFTDSDKRTTCDKLKGYIQGSLDFTLLRQTPFLLFCITGLLRRFIFSSYVPHTVSSAIAAGVSQNLAVWVLPALSLATIISRIFVSLIADKKYVNRFIIFACGLMFAFLTCIPPLVFPGVAGSFCSVVLFGFHSGLCLSLTLLIAGVCYYMKVCCMRWKFCPSICVCLPRLTFCLSQWLTYLTLTLTHDLQKVIISSNHGTEYLYKIDQILQPLPEVLTNFGWHARTDGRTDGRMHALIDGTTWTTGHRTTYPWYPNCHEMFTCHWKLVLLPSPSLSQRRKYCDARRHAVTLSRCVCVRRHSRQRR